MSKRAVIPTQVSWRVLDVVLLLSVTFHLKIILRRQKISNFITKDNRSTAGILWSSRIPVIVQLSLISFSLMS